MARYCHFGRGGDWKQLDALADSQNAAMLMSQDPRSRHDRLYMVEVIS